MSKINTPIDLSPIIDTPRFGPVPLRQENIFSFPEGLVGFSEHTHFVLLNPSKEEGAFFWLQSLENAGVAFPLVEPSLFYPEYKIRIPVHDLAAIRIKNEKHAQVFVVATVPPREGKEIWLNLKAPVILNKVKKMGKQVILENEDFPLRYKVRL